MKLLNRFLIPCLAALAFGVGQQALADTSTAAASTAAHATAPASRPVSAPPTGAHPPPGDPPPPPPGGQPPGQAHAVVLKGAFEFASKHAATLSARRFAASGTDVSAVYASHGAALYLRAPTITSDSQTSSEENSSFEGQNAALLATSRARVTLDGGTISTTGNGANGAFAADADSRITLARVGIHTQGTSAHGVDAVKGATLVLQDATIRTEGIRSAALATDRGGGAILATGGTFNTTGARSPVLYSTGTLDVRDARMQADAAEGAVVEGANAVIVSNSSLRGKTHGAMIYQSFSGDALGQQGRFTMTGGTLSTDRDALFYVTNTHATIELDHVRLTAPGGAEAVLVEARADRWGTAGQNGGTVQLLAHRQILQGVIRADRLSEAQLVLQDDSHLTGRTTRTSVTLDASSHWTLTSDAQVLALNEPAGTSPDAIPNIDSQGHLLHYDAHNPANAWLGGKRHALPGGGALLPDGKIR
ncbi:MAG: hypothetical protein ACRYHA_19775 [Janthinobacterium lividum]